MSEDYTTDTPVAGPYHGEMANFKLEAFLTAAEELCRADDPARALYLLDNLPGFYRENVPIEVINLKNDIYARLATPAWYAKSEKNQMIPVDEPNNFRSYLRGHMLLSEVKLMNHNGYTPHILDCGPGAYELPIMLKHHECKFTYEPIFLNQELFELAKPHIEPYLKKPGMVSPRIYVACEIIEHLWNETEVKTEMLRHGSLCEVIHVSTPLYSVCSTIRHFKDIETMGHLRTYTVAEFQALMRKLFPEYHMTYVHGPIQHARLTQSNSRFDLHQGEDIRELA